MSDEETTRAKNADLRGTLSPQKQALLEKRLRGKPSTGADIAIQPTSGDGPFPLSHPQQRLWFVQQFDPSATWYNRPTLLHIHGGLDIPRLEHSLGAIISRHAILRTIYPIQDGQPQSRLLPFEGVSLVQEDLQGLDPRLVQEHLQAAIRQPFDLVNGPLVRLHLFRLGQGEHQLLFVTHHITFDHWSEDVFIRELGAAYRGSDLPTLPSQYSDFAAWQRSPANETRLAPHLDYWKKQLSGQLPVIELPSDHHRPAVQDLHGGSVRLSVPEGLLTRLKEVARSNDSTLFMLLLAAFNVLLYRYTGQTDLIVGSPIAGRTRPELEGLIGCFINNLVLRTDLSGSPSFIELLTRQRKVTLEAYQHQEVPFELLVEVLKPVRDLGNTPLFQVVFNFENTPPLATQAGLPGSTRIEMAEMAAYYDLAVGLTERDGSLLCEFIYPTALFERETIQRLVSHYRVLLEGIAADPHQSIGSLPLLTPEERQRMLVTWNSATIPYPVETCVHQLFEEWAHKTPQETAVVSYGQKWSYASLNQKADQVAAALLGLGARPGSRVALFMERGPELITGIFGILKAGAAYVPLDIAFPQERISYLLSDSGAGWVLTQEKYSQTLAGMNLPLLSFEQAMRTPLPDEKPDHPAATPADLAYLLYTSGSTGQPKGVMISHGNVVAFLYSFREVRQDGTRRVGTCVAPFTFDATVEELFSCLCFGGTVHLLQPEDSSNPVWFARYLLEQGISTTFVVPDLLPGLAHELKRQGGAPQLKCLFTSLEPIRESTLQPFRELSPALRILNVYGPTETTCAVTAYAFPEMKEPDRFIPIGVPFPNCQVYILDANLQPVPAGVPGEILIGGAGVGLGYHNRPELTTEKFIPDPFSGKSGARLYRSGDLGRYLPDGNIEFLGRADDQVKLRGYRIELGEIENTLTSCPLVHMCRVLAREIQPGDRRLVAYVIPAPGTSPTAGELRQYLADRLPVYMLPNHFILLEVFPLLANGKLNRALLPLPDQVRPELGQGYTPAMTPAEQTLAGIWSKMLGLERIGIHDNFFELGGHSLLAIRLIAEIEMQMGVRLSLTTLFENPTIHQVARFMDDKDMEPGWRALVAIQPQGGRVPLFLVPPSATTGMRFARLAERLGHDQPIYSFNHLGLDGLQEAQGSVEEMVELYIREMLAFKPQGPYIVGGLCFGSQVALEMARQLTEQGRQVPALILLDPGVPFKEHAGKREKRRGGNRFNNALNHLLRGTIFKRIGKFINKINYRLNVARKRTGNVTSTHQTHRQAMVRFTTRAYAGRTLFFQSEARQKTLDTAWRELLTGQVDYFVLPGSTHADFYEKEKNLRAIAATLAAYLDDFQGQD